MCHRKDTGVTRLRVRASLAGDKMGWIQVPGLHGTEKTPRGAHRNKGAGPRKEGDSNRKEARCPRCDDPGDEGWGC